MEVKNLYKFRRIDGGITVSTLAPEVPYTLMYRIIASDGMLVTQDGVTGYPAIDTDSDKGWYEIEDSDAVSEENGGELNE